MSAIHPHQELIFDDEIHELPHLPHSNVLSKESNPIDISSSNGSEKGQVVIIGDDLNLSELLRDELIGSGFTVHSYSQVSQALRAIEELKPDAVVLDLVLKDGENGWEVIEKMRNHPHEKPYHYLLSDWHDDDADDRLNEPCDRHSDSTGCSKTRLVDFCAGKIFFSMFLLKARLHSCCA
ncbi:response regulator [Brevibacillus invocatus]|nr:response regulator [Brevibacillus invocatus]MCM3078657.1 response regulator [Brevibacillus invocatus]MCM3429094.1 response regulator [Brevibacillus invocatus]